MHAVGRNVCSSVTMTQCGRQSNRYSQRWPRSAMLFICLFYYMTHCDLFCIVANVEQNYKQKQLCMDKNRPVMLMIIDSTFLCYHSLASHQKKTFILLLSLLEIFVFISVKVAPLATCMHNFSLALHHLTYIWSY